jgi:3-deoxy-D-manno-octulosonate 8-phosphate phosphatase (KDO 8-P phosphatase)
MVGLSCCPNDAAPEVRNIVDYISNKKGGNGCVRDIIEQVLTINGDWNME